MSGCLGIRYPFWALGPILGQAPPELSGGDSLFFEEGLASRIVAEDTLVRYSPLSGAPRLQARKKP
jgi:hypothetical protein